jgi:NAD(P)-dependent dehydrogenase (short-subunit alcohol dehydrogenase family)
MAAVVDTALMGSAHVIRAVLPAMAARGRGVLVGVSSGLGRSVARGMAPYCAAKWGLEGLMRALALDLPPGLAAVTLDPGAIDTEMLRRYIGESARQHPPPATWAATAVPWLLALDGRVNGQALTLRGGATLAARALSRLRRP